MTARVSDEQLERYKDTCTPGVFAHKLIRDLLDTRATIREQGERIEELESDKETIAHTLNQACERLEAKLSEQGERIKELDTQLRDRAADTMPHSFVVMKWACGHEGPASCLECSRVKDAEIGKLRSELDEWVLGPDTPREELERLYRELREGDAKRSSQAQEIERLSELLWKLYEGIYGHRKCEHSDYATTAVEGVLYVQRALAAERTAREAAEKEVERMKGKMLKGLLFP